MKYFFPLFLWVWGLAASQAQNPQWKVVWGPMPGHFDAESRQYLLLIDTLEKPKQASESLGAWLAQQEGEVLKTEIWPIGPKSAPHRVNLKVWLSKGKTINPESDWSFLLGSCAFQFQFPFGVGIKRRKRNRIFDKMAQHQDAQFMLWLGDNIYLVLGQWKTRKRIAKEYLRVRKRRPIGDFLKSMPQYATWDDHDYGPNNCDGSYEGKDLSLDMFKTFWANPSYGQTDKDGIYTKFTQGDAEFFMLDSRYHCSKEEGCMFSGGQVQWLKESLRSSTANFKFVICGSQMLSQDPVGENLNRYPFERQNLLDFLQKEDIKGVILLSGDRHFSELSRLERPNRYPLYEYTCSPMTSFVDAYFAKANDLRIPGTYVPTQNFGKIEIEGQGQNRLCRFLCYSTYGVLMWEHEVYLRDLQ